MPMTAIMVDGGFYKKQSSKLFGEKTPNARADEMIEYCYRHIKAEKETRTLYRIFYYDCPPSQKTIYHPLTQKSVNLGKTELFDWTNNFFYGVAMQT